MVDVTLDDAHRDRLRIACNRAGDEGRLRCAATLAMILEDKTALGLAGAPSEDIPWERLPESVLESRALAERAERAATEKMTVKSVDPREPWTDYTVASALSGKTYRVAVRGLARGESYCACPDFRKNLLGTCKHVLKVHAWLKRRFGPARLAQAWRPDRFAVFARYDGDLRLGLQIPARTSPAAARIAAPWRSRFARAERRAARAGRDGARARAGGRIGDRLSRCGGNPRSRPAPAPAERARGRRSARTRRRIRCGASCCAPSCFPISSTASRSPPGPGARCWPTRWGSARPSRASASRSSSRARPGSSASSSCARPRSSRSGARRSGASRGRSVQLVAGTSAERARAVRERRLLHDLQLRAGAARLPRHRAHALGPDHPRRSAAHQELGGEDQPHHQEPALAVRARAHRHAAREPARRSLLGGRVHRRPPARPGVPLHPPASGGERSGQGARLQEPRRACASACEPVLLRRTRASVALELPPRTTEIVRITPTDEQLALHGAQMQMVQTIVSEDVPHRDGSAAPAEGAAPGPDVGEQHLPRRQAAAGLLQQARARSPSCSKRSAPSRRASSSSSASGRRCSISSSRSCGGAGPASCAWTAPCRRRSASGS